MHKSESGNQAKSFNDDLKIKGILNCFCLSKQCTFSFKKITQIDWFTGGKNTLIFRCFKCDLTCELTKRKCICKNVNKACKIGWAIKIFSTQFFSIVACIAISKPVKIRVPKPNTEKIKIILVYITLKHNFHDFLPLTKITQFYSWNHRGQKTLRFHELFSDLIFLWN